MVVDSRSALGAGPAREPGSVVRLSCARMDVSCIAGPATGSGADTIALGAFQGQDAIAGAPDEVNEHLRRLLTQVYGPLS